MRSQEQEQQAYTELVRLALLGKLLLETGQRWQISASFDKIRTPGARLLCVPSESIGATPLKKAFSYITVVNAGLTGSRLLRAVDLATERLLEEYATWQGYVEEYQGSYPRA